MSREVSAGAGGPAGAGSPHGHAGTEEAWAQQGAAAPAVTRRSSSPGQEQSQDHQSLFFTFVFHSVCGLLIHAWIFFSFNTVVSDFLLA